MMNVRLIALSIIMPLGCAALSAQSEGSDSMSLGLDEVVVTGSNRAVSRDLTPYISSCVASVATVRAEC